MDKTVANVFIVIVSGITDRTFVMMFVINVWVP